MLKQTDLTKAKSTARMLLELPMEIIDGGLIVIHPYFVSTYAAAEVDGKIQSVDLTTDEGMKAAKKAIRDGIEKVESYHRFLRMIRGQYLPIFFKMTKEHLSLEDYSEFLSDMWTTIEFPNADTNVTKAEFVSFFKNADKQILMDEKEYAVYTSLSKEITVYRGVGKRGKVNGLSWTLELEQAKWFANRFEPVGVYKAKINKKYVLAYFNGRNEQEIVLDYRKLTDIEEVSE